MDNFDIKTAIRQAVARTEQDAPTRFDVSPLTIRAQQGQGMIERGFASDNPEQIAEGYALLGNYEQAVNYATGDRYDEYHRVLVALGDHGPCACIKHLGVGTKRTPTAFVKERFLRNGAEIALWACVTCGKHWTE